MAPVVTAALGALGPLVGKLTDLLANESRRLKGVRREIRSLRSEFHSMETALDQYATLQDPGRQVKQWVSLVRELAYDTEDLFDKFMRHLGNGNRHDGGYKEFSRKAARRLKTLGARHGIASQIEDLKRRIKDVKDLKTSYELPGTDCSMARHATIDPRLAALFAGEENLVGIDGPRDDLAQWMEKGNNHRRKVLSIVGFGGLGKTTLANAVYRKIQRRFDCHAFVSVSQEPDRKKIIRSVISQVPHNSELTRDMNTWDEWQYITKLRELLQNKRYLVIIDDIWSTFAWNAIECAFPENYCSSRIIATTRITEVAQSCSPDHDDKIYEMRPLSDLNSERLFFKRIVGSKDSCPKMLSEVSYEILKKCGGLPLAIISISSLLANRPCVKEEWEKVKSSIGSDLSKNQNLEGMRNILSLSYNDLSPNLKTCLLYLSNFPEDCVIGRERLVRRWIAEGFISEERGRSRQEVAETYFNELMNKSLIQPVGVDYDGRPRHACQVHDMMLELIISKSTEENFITLVNGRQTVWEDSHCFIRRLSIQEIDQELASELAKKDLSHVRSLTVTSSSCIKYLPSLAKFKALRVLDFEGCEGFGCLEEYDMNGMEDLFLLKYLSFRDTSILELPSGIVMLHGLETLDLWGTRIWELPPRIVELTNLEYLLYENNGGIWALKIPKGIGNMTNLREISGLNITISSVDAVEELGNLINLNVLGVLYNPDPEFRTDKYKRHADALISSVRKLGSYKLHSVSIDTGNIDRFELLERWSPPSGLQSFEMKPYYRLSEELKLTAPALTSLVNLGINLREVTEEDVLILAELPALLYLNLKSTLQKDRLTVKKGGFRCLKLFDFLVSEAFWENLLFEKGAMPNLERLSVTAWVRGLASAAESYGFYLGIEHLNSLKVVKLTVFESHHCYEDGTSSLVSAICKSAEAAVKKEANLHPNRPRVTLYGQDVDCNIDDEVNEDQNTAGVEVNVELDGVEVNEDQSYVDDEANEKQSDADEYSDAISSPMHEGTHSP